MSATMIRTYEFNNIANSATIYINIREEDYALSDEMASNTLAKCVADPNAWSLGDVVEERL